MANLVVKLDILLPIIYYRLSKTDNCVIFFRGIFDIYDTMVRIVI